QTLDEGIGLVDHPVEEGQGGLHLQVMGRGAVVGQRLVVGSRGVLGQGGGVEPLGGGPGEKLQPGAQVGRARGGGELTVIRRRVQAFEEGSGVIDHGSKGGNRP
ncbi:MAG: hypothetical protein ACI9DF_005893, partial [Verrucomicrobiales bacterium]